MTADANSVDVYTTLDLNLQRAALDAVRTRPGRRWTRHWPRAARKAPGRAQAALVAVDPRTGEILAMVGGRSYNQSQFNRAVDLAAPARLGLQAVRLPGRVRARRPHRASRT